MAGRDSTCPALRAEKGLWFLLQIIPSGACLPWTGLQCNYLRIFYTANEYQVLQCVLLFPACSIRYACHRKHGFFREYFVPVKWCYSRLARAIFGTTIDGSTWRKWRKLWENLDRLFSTAEELEKDMFKGMAWCYLEAKNLGESMSRELPRAHSGKRQLHSTKILFITGTFSRYTSHR